jgi:carbamate kinase
VTPTTIFAVGGNALAPAGGLDAEGQRERARGVAEQVVAIAEENRRVVVVHGNGPQVGALAIAQEAVARELPPQPLFALGAMTQGQLGCLLADAIGEAQRARGAEMRVAALMTRVVVDEADPAFAAPTKPIGPFFPEGRARRLSESRGWTVAEDAGRGWRRVVPSPAPIEVLEWLEVNTLLDAGDVVIAGGGGGVPVSRREETLVGVEAVIDKDATAALIGRLLRADDLLLLTGVERVMLGFGTPAERAVDTLTLAEARAHLAEGEFPPGSMGPKIAAAISFVEDGGSRAVITSLERGADALAGRAGTRIVA